MSEFGRLTDHDRLHTWRGAINRPTHVGFARNPLCGDEVWVDLDVVGGTIRQARFHGQGCMVSQACASMLCEGIEEKLLDDVMAQSAEEVMDFEIRELSMNRQRCALTAWEAFLRALHDSEANGERVVHSSHVESVAELESADPVAKPP